MTGRSSLPGMDVSGRVPRLRTAMDGRGLSTLVVTNLTNIRYLTGFTGSAALLVLLPDELLFVSDGRYGEQSRDELSAAGVAARIEITSVGQRELVSAACAGIDRVALEAGAVSWAQQRRYDESWFPGAELVATEDLVEGLRLDKDPGEVARVEAAAAIADAALAEVRPSLVDGPTERQFGLALDQTMRLMGADDLSFETIVASGPNGARPHARPGPRVISEGDLVVIDFGALVDGYHSDMTRTMSVGEPTGMTARMPVVVTEAQRRGVDAVRAGAACSDVDAVCRGVIADAGWADAFVHGTGHGVGLDIHEAPRVASTSTAVLETGQIVTVEPGVYLPDHGGVRVEDTVLVTDDGCRPLTHAPKWRTVA